MRTARVLNGEPPVSERQIKLSHHGCLQAASRAADLADWNREELVDQQLGSFAQAIDGAGIKAKAAFDFWKLAGGSNWSCGLRCCDEP